MYQDFLACLERHLRQRNGIERLVTLRT